MIQCVGGALDLADNSLGAMQSDSQALIRTPTAGSCVDLNALQQSFPSSLVTDTIGTFVTLRTVGIVDTSCTQNNQNTFVTTIEYKRGMLKR